MTAAAVEDLVDALSKTQPSDIELMTTTDLVATIAATVLIEVLGRRGDARLTLVASTAELVGKELNRRLPQRPR